MDIIRPEVLAPAGDAERLKAAVYYGADAVYMGGTRFGMRAAPKNFSDDELARAVSFAHENGVKVYLTCNIIPNTAQLKELPEFLEAASAAGVDALIITDLGVLSYAKKYAPKVPIHISTQTGVANAESARMLFDLGAERVVSARELTLDELADLRSGMPKEMELECFVHGAMCVSYSGRCLLSNYLTDRHSNKGECSQPCRWEYSLMERTRHGEYFPIEETASGTYIMNSKDMCMIEHIPELIDAGIDSFKIEGRMKSSYYAAVVTNAYHHAIDAAVTGAPLDPLWVEEVNKVSHRPYTTGFYFGEPGQYYHDATYFTDADVAAVVEDCDADGNAVLYQRNKFYRGDELELLTTDAAPVKFTVEHMYNSEGEEIDDTRHAMMEIHMRLPRYAERYSIVRKCR